MAKKMKGVAASDLSAAYGGGGGGYGVASVSSKHQNLLQDYQDLQRETDAMRHQLEAAQQRKRSLMAEVRFLRKRYNYLSTMKSANSLQEQEAVIGVPLDTQKRLGTKDRISKKKNASLRKLPPLPNSNHKRKSRSGKEAPQTNTSATLNSDHKQILCVGKEAVQYAVSPLQDFNQNGSTCIANEVAVLNVAPIIDLNVSGRNGGIDAAVPSTAPALDLNRDGSFSGRDAPFPSRAPIFDLNEVSTAEEDVQSNSAPLKFEELKKNLVGPGTDEQLNDLMLSVCRNSGEGPSRVGKRKISWQDPVALRV